ncbi:MAG: hypothetical protein R3F61_13780 [Myxococcota bacterium]
MSGVSKKKPQETSPAPAVGPTPAAPQMVAGDQDQARLDVDAAPDLDEASWLDGIDGYGVSPTLVGPPAPPDGSDGAVPASDEARAAEEAARREADRQLAVDTFAQLDDAMGVGVFDLADADAARELLAGRTPDQMRAIRAYYEEQTGRSLESDVVGQFGGVDQNEMMASVLAGMDLRDKLEHFETGETMSNLLAQATPEELAELVAGPDGTVDRSVLDTLRESMSDDDYMAARIKLFPEEATAAVADRIRQCDNLMDDDEGTAMAAFASLSLDDRRRLLQDQPDLLDFMDPVQRARFDMIASSESAALRARMEQATKGAGTDDDALPGIIADTARLRREETQIREALAADGLTEERRAELEGRLGELGHVNEVLAPRRNPDGSLVEDSFLGQLRGDVSADQTRMYMEQMGFSASEVAKQTVIDAMGRWNDDERGVEEAFASVPAAERQALWDDPHIQAALTTLDPEERAVVESFRDNDVRAMSESRIRDGDGFFGDNEAQILGAVMDMNDEDRLAFVQSDLFISTYSTLNATEREALMEAIRTGAVSTDTLVDAATTGLGTNEDLLDLAADRKSTDETLAIRRGYVLAQEGIEPETPEDEAALALYTRTAEAMAGDMDGDEYQAQMDAMLGHHDPAASLYDGVVPEGPSSAEIERATADGRMTASLLMDGRADEKMGEDGEGGGGLSAFFSDTDETAVASHQIQKGSHYEAILDGEVTEQELSDHEVRSQAFDHDFQAMIDAQNTITDAVTTGASIGAGVLATVFTGGLGSPALAAAITAAIGTGTKMITQEVMGGDRYDMTGEAGATDLAMGAVDAGTGYLGGKFGDLIQDAGARWMPGVIRSTDDVTGAALRDGVGDFVRGQLPSVLLNTTADTVSSGVLGSVVENAGSSDFWEQSFEDMASELGGDALGSVPASLRDALIQTGVKTGMLTLDASRTARFMDDLEASGVSPADLDGMTLADIQAMGRAQAELDAGRPAQAAEAIGETELSEVDQQQAAAVAVEESGTVQGPADTGPAAEVGPEIELTPEIQAALDPSGGPKLADEVQNALPEPDLDELQTRAERVIMEGGDEAMGGYLLDHFEDAAKLQSVLDTHDVDLGDGRAPLGAPSANTYPLIHPETGDEIGFVRGDQVIYRFEPKDVPTPMTPHESPTYFNPYDTHRAAGTDADQALFVVDSPEGVVGLERLRERQDYFNDPSIVMRSTTYDEIMAAYPDARIMIDAKMEYTEDFEGARVISTNADQASGLDIRYQDYGLDEIDSVVDGMPASGTVRADVDLIKAFKEFEPGQSGTIPEGPDGFSLDGVPEYLREMNDFGLYRNADGQVVAVRGAVPDDAVEVLLEPGSR